ncbi:MAG: sigma-70 family RNA polymerase sigma factor [Firmicutes bacterium]|nr:sigma-70 family RNA polymerase sigma factor [Bacillota bacterium]
MTEYKIDERLVRVLARKYANSQNEEEDLFQEGQIAYLRAIQTFDESKNIRIEAYATRIIKNRFIDLLRKKRDTSQDVDSESASAEYSLDQRVSLIEIKQILATHIADIDRAIFNSYIEGFSYDEISKIFDLPKKKIDNIIQKVKRAIRERVDG